MILRRGFSAVHAGSPFNDVQIELENAPLAEDAFGERHERILDSLAHEGMTCGEEQVLDQLLRDRGSAAQASSVLLLFFDSVANLLPIEAMMLVKAAVFGGNHGVLKIGRDAVERNKRVALAVGCFV